MMFDIESAARRRQLEARMKSKQEKKDKGIAPKVADQSHKIGSEPGVRISYNTIKQNKKLDDFE